MALFGKKIKTKEVKPAAAAVKETVEAVKDQSISKAALAVVLPALLVQPRISEKAGHLVNLNKYVFKVKPSANKVEVRKAVQAAYKVKVVNVNMINVKGKKRNYGRTVGRTSGFKKAIVTLKKGDKIEGLTDVV
jgi:large subunit ribosomal protein L23